MTAMDKDRLAAFVDGELSPEEAAAVVMHLADNPADQAWVDDLIAANEALAQAFGGPLGEPVPPAIMAAIMGAAPSVQADNVVAFRPRPRWPLAAGMALAAAVAAVAVLVTVPAGRGDSIAVGPVVEGSGLAGLLDTAASGVPVTFDNGAEAMVLASFAMPDGRICREFEVIDLAADRIDYGISCRTDDAWAVEVAVADLIEGDEGEGFVPASGGETEALSVFLDGAGASIPLDPAAEADAMARGWAVE
jgi:hypothetical protein